jgi:hypothetical protein
MIRRTKMRIVVVVVLKMKPLVHFHPAFGNLNTCIQTFYMSRKFRKELCKLNSFNVFFIARTFRKKRYVVCFVVVVVNFVRCLRTLDNHVG